MTNEPRPGSRSERIRTAIIADLKHAGEPVPLSGMTQARGVATNSRELHVIVQRLLESGRIVRHGRGYHQGDPYRYELSLAPF